MSEAPTGRQESTRRYEIRFGGHLHSRWDSWFDGLTVTGQSDGTTVVEGPVADQAALHGLLRKLHDLGLPLLSVAPTSNTPKNSTLLDPAPRSPIAPSAPRPTRSPPQRHDSHTSGR